MENQQQQNTSLCRANCGFYGSPATEDLCSKCFKDMIKRKQDTGNGVAAAPAQQQQLTQSSLVVAATASATGTTQNSLSGEPASAQTASSTSLADDAQSCAATTDNLNDTSRTPPEQKKPNRCQVCKKRVGLTGFVCRCGGLYCGEHRYDTAHNCTFDYKTTGRDELRKKHPMVISDKVQQI